MAISLLLTSSGQDWHFHIPTDMKWSGMAISSLLLISSGQECQFHISTDI